MPDRAAAIKLIEESRQTHVEWLAYLTHPAVVNCGCDDCEETKRLVGDADHHRKYIAGYDDVLVLLRG